jgi:hypothetical protein
MNIELIYREELKAYKKLYGRSLLYFIEEEDDTHIRYKQLFDVEEYKYD